MIKLKVSRSELQVLVSSFNPAVIEKHIQQAISFNDIRAIGNLFPLLETSEAFTKKYFFTANKNYKLSIKYAYGAALFIAISKLETTDWDDYTASVLLSIKSALHHQLFNYQMRFNDATGCGYALTENTQIKKLGI